MNFQFSIKQDVIFVYVLYLHLVCVFLGKGRYEDAEKSLCWLRGWVSPNDVQRELNILKKFIRTKSTESKTSLREIVRNYGNRSFIIPHLIVIMTFFFGHFGGMMSVQTNAVRQYFIVMYSLLCFC